LKSTTADFLHLDPSRHFSGTVAGERRAIGKFFFGKETSIVFAIYYFLSWLF
jgi:hypothetical protein